MFSGIIEATARITHIKKASQAIRLGIGKPDFFNDLKLGDSIAVDGVCLTLEEQTEQTLFFTVGAESLRVLKWFDRDWSNKVVNLERSMRLGDRIHGHLVTGHVEDLAVVHKSFADGDSWQLQVQVPVGLSSFVWHKGSVTLNGVSLTVNRFVDRIIEVCLIPETIHRTNLSSLKTGDLIHVEVDYLAKALIHAHSQKLSELKDKNAL